MESISNGGRSDTADDNASRSSQHHERRKVLLRIVVFAASLPFFFVLLFVATGLNHLLLNICCVIASIIGSLEVAHMVAKRGMRTSKIVAPAASGTLPLVAYLDVTGLIGDGGTEVWLLIVVLVILLRSVFSSTPGELSSTIPFVAVSLFIALYPGLFISFIVRMTSLANAESVLLLFFSTVFVNDTVAYLTGTLVGKRTRLGLAVSPGKTAAGFVAGLASSIGMVILFRAVFPDVVSVPFATAVLFGVMIGVIAILGDLFESALKRSAELKDSGWIIPGRGGLLDSIDSLLLSAPVFFYGVLLMFR